MKNFKKWSITGFFIIVIVGSLFHFIYEWSGKNPIVGVFGAVNESTWEHLKLLFWPTLFYAIFGYFSFGKKYPNYFYASLLSILFGICLIVVIFYTYTGIIGKNFLILDIGSFVISVAISQYINYRILNSKTKSNKNINLISLCILFILIVLFVVFTFKPPHIPLFQDPLSGLYGIKK